MLGDPVSSEILLFDLSPEFNVVKFVPSIVMSIVSLSSNIYNKINVYIGLRVV